MGAVSPQPELAGSAGVEPRTLAVALLLDDMTQPRWVHDAIECVADSRIARFVLICIGEHTPELPPRRGTRSASAAPAWLWHAYQKLDGLLFEAGPDPLAPVDLTALVGTAPRSTAETLPALCASDDAPPPAQFDVLLAFGDVRITQQLLAQARYGAWIYRFGPRSVSRIGTAAGCEEVMGPSETTEAALFTRLAGESADIELHRIRARTVPFSLRRNRDNILRKASCLAAREMRCLQATGKLAPTADAACAVAQAATDSAQVAPSPPPVRSLARVGQRIVTHALQRMTCRDQWVVAYKFGPPRGPDESLSDCQVAMPPADRSWADPFAFKRGGRSFIFLEELPFAAGRGHIAVSELGPYGAWSAPFKVLERDYHLSYPFLFEWRGDLFMVPETGRNRTVELYRCTGFPGTWEAEQVLLDGIYSADATFALIDGTWWMFVIAATADTEPYDELHLFYAASPAGPWRAHRRNPVKCDARSARPAGGLFNWRGTWYRPAQVCTPLYGAGISINEITCLTKHEYAEREVRHILADWQPGLAGCHTLNRDGELLVTDGFIRRRRRVL